MKIKTMLFIIICLVATPPLSAQNNAAVKSVFDRYGKQKGSIMIQLSTDILSPKTDITFYRSLVIKQNDIIYQTVASALEDVANQGTKLTEIRKNGKLENAAYSIPVNSDNNEYDYILYNYTDSQITLVYMKGKFPPKNLDKELKKLKDLFIYINK